MIQQVGATQILLTLNPDPPTVGSVHAHVQVSSLTHAVRLRYTSSMPAMQMNGASGSVSPSTDGSFDFDLPVPMASAWSLDLHLSGAVSGTAHYQFAVIGGAGNGSMAAMSGGNVDAWRNAVFALIILIVIAAFVLRRDRRPATVGLFGAAVGLILILAILQNRYAAPSMDSSSMSTVQGVGATPVTLALVRIGASRTVVSAPATIQAYLTQDVTARVSGIVSNMTAYVGDRVSQGQVLATLDAAELGTQAQAASSDAQAQAATARAAEIEAHHHAPLGAAIARNEASAAQTELVAAQADARAKGQQRSYWASEIAREESLYRQGAVSTQELQNERAQAAGANAAYQGASQHALAMQQQLEASRTRTMDAQASISIAQNNAISAQAQAGRASNNAQSAEILAGYRTVTSPSAALVTKRLVDPGVYVQAGTPILRLAVVDRLRLQASVSQQDLRSVHVGTPFDATSSSGVVLRGRVSAVSPAADPTTHTAIVEAILEGRRTGVSPGDYIRVRFHTGAQSGNGIQVPSSAVVGGGANSAVWTDVSGTAHRVSVRVLSDDGSTATLAASLKNRERVVVDGAATLEEGQAISEQPR